MIFLIFYLSLQLFFFLVPVLQYKLTGIKMLHSRAPLKVWLVLGGYLLAVYILRDR